MTEQTAIRWEEGSDGIVTLVLDDPNQSANTMNELYQSSMHATVTRLAAEKDRIKGVILTSAKKTFFAGGDLKMLSQPGEGAQKLMFDSTQALKADLRLLETFGKPVVAAINGAALGGGLEIALATHYRIAIDDPRLEVGLPESGLGLLPGGGGVVRTVRMLGIQKALMNVLLPGTRFKPAQAKENGLIDEVVADRDAMIARAKEWILANPTAKQPWDKDGYKMPGGTPAVPSFAANLPAFPANLRKQLKGAHYPAPRAIMSAAVEGAQVDFDNAIKIETRYFVELATGKVAKNMIKAFFFDMQKINSGAARPKNVEKWAPKKLGVLGAGMMGQGIAYVSAMAGIPVVLKDVSTESAAKGKAYTEKLLGSRVKKGAMTQEKADGILALITPTGSADDLAGCDMIIEAVFENRDLKATVTKEAEAKGAPGLLMCSNTSTLPITGLATASKDPKNFIGLHFFSPVDKMPLVEIIVGKETSDQALAWALDYVFKIKKTPIVVNDSRGFFTSRVFGTFLMEGVAMLGEGYPAASIEQAALQSGMPVGPIAVADEVSLELPRHARAQTIKDYAAEGKTYVAHPSDAVIDRMVDEFGRKGKAAGSGFYEYPADGKKHLWSGLSAFAKAELAAPSADVFQDMKDRILFIQSIETIRCLEEGVLRSVEDANIGSIMGIGAPPWTGGLLQYVNYVGLRKFAARAKELEAKYGARFSPPKLLLEKAEKGERFE